MGKQEALYVELSEALKEKLEKRVDELGMTKREYIENAIREDTEEVTLDDPSVKLAEVERQLQDAHEKLDELHDEETAVRKRIKELEREKERLEAKTQKSGLVTASSYDDAVEFLIERAVEDEIHEVGSNVERVAEEWGRETETVCRDVFERSVRVRKEDVKLTRRIPYYEVPSDWETEWPTYEEAVEILADLLLDEGVLSQSQSTPNRLCEQYDRDYADVAGDLLEAADTENIGIVEPDIGEDISPSDAPEADLVVGKYTARKIGLETEAE
jgi:DNA repair exonuclease SbcCD ATPase subunit